MATILLAEDNEAVRLLTQAKLRHQFTVVTAANGREALDILNRQHVDLIVADVMMPVMDGYQLVRTLRAEGNEIPVLFLTALQSMDSKREGFSSGIDDYLTKPVDYEELIWRMLYYDQESYYGKTVKANGIFAIYQMVVDGVTQPAPVAYACIIADATACCAEGMEFVLEGDYTYPDDYPELGAEITVIGEFQSYEENGMTWYHLVNARLA